MPARQVAPCLKCLQPIEISQSAFVIDLMLRGVGLPKELEISRLSQSSVSSCITCCDLMARGDEPPMRSQPLNHVVYQMVREVVANDPTFAFLSWLELRREQKLPTARFDDPKFLQQWNRLRQGITVPTLIEQNGEGKTALVKVG
jgi:hypothetical protein